MTESPFAPLLALAALACAPAFAQELAPDERARFDASDDEGRWVVFAASVADAPEKRAAWIALLSGRDLVVPLEWIALYDQPEGARQALSALQELDAPQWIRVGVWMLERRFDSHAEGLAKTVLQRRNDLLLGWLERYPEARSEAVDAIAQEALAQGVRPAGAARYLPPLDPARVFAALDPTAVFEDLGERLRAEPGARYRHQAERAIDGFAMLREHRPPWSERLLHMTRHGDEALARRACLAYAHFRPQEVPVELLLERVEHPGVPTSVREAALIGLSYGPHPRAYLVCLGIAEDSEHVAWSAAVSRLGDLGDAFVVDQLAAVEVGRERSALLEAELERILARDAELLSNPAELAASVRPLLERAAYAELVRDVHARALGAWTLQRIVLRAALPDVRAELEALAAGYEPEPGLALETDLGTMEARVRALAREVAARASGR